MEPSFLKEDNSSGHFDFNEKSSDDDYSSDFNKVTISLTFYLAFCGGMLSVLLKLIDIKFEINFAF